MLIFVVGMVEIRLTEDWPISLECRCFWLSVEIVCMRLVEASPISVKCQCFRLSGGSIQGSKPRVFVSCTGVSVQYSVRSMKIDHRITAAESSELDYSPHTCTSWRRWKSFGR